MSHTQTSAYAYANTQRQCQSTMEIAKKHAKNFVVRFFVVVGDFVHTASTTEPGNFTVNWAAPNILTASFV